ncbi:HN1_G0049360.mRNA.1.CDS.1 [Saccharomyces cerevisiae]|nr:HN1_G0049360.mRNA.1.CDS.1 [Saccharomyces cerevisiae]
MQTSSENTNAKSDSLDEPSAYLIEENVALPKDIFGSYLRTSMVVIAFSEPIGDREFKVKLLMEIITRKPAVKGKEWRTITYKMNQYLFDHGLWDTPYYFYRDEDCHRYFLSLIKGKTFRKPEKLSSNVMDGQRNEGNKTFTLHSKPNLQKCLSKAAEIEQQSQDEYWRQDGTETTRNTIVIGNTRYILAMQTPPESTDVKLDTLNEPSAHLIEKNVALPKDIFRSYLSYWIYEIARYTPVMILSLVIGVLVLLIIFFNDNEACVFNSAILAFTSLVVLLIILGDGNPKLVSRRNFRTELLVDVITRKPAVEGKEWRIITYNMNQYLFNHGQWHTPYYFYSDEDCYRYFLRLVEGLTPKKQTATSIGNSPVTAKPEDAIESASPSSRLNYRNFLLKAAEIERQAQENYWRRRHPNIDALLKKTE